jgi:hypothetical protein
MLSTYSDENGHTYDETIGTGIRRLIWAKNRRDIIPRKRECISSRHNQYKWKCVQLRQVDLLMFIS